MSDEYAPCYTSLFALADPADAKALRDFLPTDAVVTTFGDLVDDPAQAGDMNVTFLIRPGEADRLVAARRIARLVQPEGPRELRIVAASEWAAGMPFERYLAEVCPEVGIRSPGLFVVWVGEMPAEPLVDPDSEGQSAHAKEWPPLRLNEPPPAKPFPIEVFPEPLQRYAREVARTTAAPLDYVGAAMLAVAAAAIGQSVNIRLRRDWSEPTLLYVILVGGPGKAKSPVIRKVRKPLAEIDRRLRGESDETRKRWAEAKKRHDRDDSAPPPGPEPPQLRAIVRDITRESLVVVLKDNPRGVLDDPDEASAWVASFNEYKGKGGSDRQFWLSLWSCDAVTVDRKGGRESTYVPFPSCSLLGGIPPSMLGSLSEERGRDDGLLDRILFVYPGADAFPSQRWSEAELSEEAEAAWSEVITRLFETPMTKDAGSDLPRPYFVGFTDSGKATWVDWYDRHADEAEAPDFPERQAGAWSKMRAHAARFALILSRLRGASAGAAVIEGAAYIDTPDDPVWGASAGLRVPPGPTDACNVLGAAKLADYFKAHLLRAHHETTSGLGSRHARTILEWIKRHRKARFREAEVCEHLRYFRDHPRDLADGLRSLDLAGAIRLRDEPPTPGKRGPKPSAIYDVHPDLLNAPGNSANSAIAPPMTPEPCYCGISGIIADSPEPAPDIDSYAIAEREAIQGESAHDC